VRVRPCLDAQPAPPRRPRRPLARPYGLRPARQAGRLPWHDAAASVLTARYMEQLGLGGSSEVPPMVTRAVDRQLTALAVSTVSSYAGKWRRFANYCALQRTRPTTGWG
jgi:hypothetical protein